MPYSDAIALKQASVMAINTTGSHQRVALCLRSGPIVAYEPVQNSAQIIAPLDLVIQAYAVSSSTKCWRSILSEEDRQRPLMASPLSCGSLPGVSTLTLCEDQNGDIRLKSQEQSEPGGKEASQTLSDIKAQLDTVLKALGDTQDRLTKVENSVAQAQDGVESGKKALADMQTQISTPVGSPRPNRNPAMFLDLAGRLPAVETKVRDLAKSFGQTQDYLAGVQRFLQSTRNSMTTLERAVPEIEAKTEKLAESVGQTQQDLSTMQEALEANEDNLVVLGGRVANLEQQGEEGQRSPFTFPDQSSGDTGTLEPDSSEVPLFPWAQRGHSAKENEVPGPPPALSY